MFQYKTTVMFKGEVIVIFSNPYGIHIEFSSQFAKPFVDELSVGIAQIIDRSVKSPARYTFQKRSAGDAN